MYVQLDIKTHTVSVIAQTDVSTSVKYVQYFTAITLTVVRVIAATSEYTS